MPTTMGSTKHDATGALGRPRPTSLAAPVAAPALATPRRPPPPLPARARPKPMRPPPVPVSRDLLEETFVKPLQLAAIVTPRPLPASPASQTTVPSRRRKAETGIASPSSPSLLRRVLTRIGADYRALSVPKRLLIPITVVLLAIGAPSSSRAGEHGRSSAPPPAVTTAVAAAATAGEHKVLPSARALAVPVQAKLTPEERRAYDQAITATLAGDYDTAQTTYARLAVAHPDSSELAAALRVLALKKKKKVGR